MRVYVVSIAMIVLILTTWIFGYLPLEYFILLTGIFSLVIGIDLKYNKEVNEYD